MGFACAQEDVWEKALSRSAMVVPLPPEPRGGDWLFYGCNNENNRDTRHF